MKKDYGYILNQVYTEFNRMVDINSHKYRDHFIKFSEKHNYLLSNVFFICNKYKFNSCKHWEWDGLLKIIRYKIKLMLKL